MSLPKSLYEPKLVDRWTKRYRDFETDELVRRLRKARQKPKSLSPDKRPDNPKRAA
jgi:hypothetical protein